MNPLDELEGLLEVTDAVRGESLVDLSRRLSNSIWLPTLVELAALRWSRWRAGVGDLRQLLRPPRGSNLAALLDASANLPLVALGAPASGRTAELRLLEGEVVEVPAEGEGWQPGRPLARFEERFRDALVRQGYPGHGADLLSAALREMESNAAEHAWAPIAPLACYQVRAGGWAFSVTDVGCGILDSLRRNPVYAGVTNAHDALELALRPGVSCTGERGRGHGFTTLFKSLVDRNCWLRIRSAGVGGRWTGRSPTSQTLELVVLPERTGMHIAVGSFQGPMTTRT